MNGVWMGMKLQKRLEIAKKLLIDGHFIRQSSSDGLTSYQFIGDIYHFN